VTIKRINRGSGHGYTIDCKNAISVTTALGIVAKPALVGAAARVVAQRVLDMDTDGWTELYAKGRQNAEHDLARSHTAKWNEAATRGTRVHALAEKISAGLEVEVPDELWDHARSVTAFLDDWQVRPLLIETVVGDYSYQYAGTFDLIGDLPDGRRVLFDYKTSSSGIYPETAVQLAAYRWASHYLAPDGTEMPMTEVGVTDCMAVHVRADGYSVHPLRADTQVFGAFINALHLARTTQDWISWVGDAVSPSQNTAVAA
jgi:hypothetical protein